jgi:hypothetical protein
MFEFIEFLRNQFLKIDELLNGKFFALIFTNYENLVS